MFFFCSCPAAFLFLLLPKEETTMGFSLPMASILFFWLFLVQSSFAVGPYNDLKIYRYPIPDKFNFDLPAEQFVSSSHSLSLSIHFLYPLSPSDMLSATMLPPRSMASNGLLTFFSFPLENTPKESLCRTQKKLIFFMSLFIPI